PPPTVYPPSLHDALPILALMRRQERDQLVRQWNQTTTDYERDGCVHQLFEAQVRKAPSAIALELDARTMTYGELNERANRLARRSEEHTSELQSPYDLVC